MKEKIYEVGQIIYLLSTKNTKVFPAKITEEIVRKTIDASITDYVVLLPNKDETSLRLRDISAIPFSSVDDLRSYMIENAQNSINTMISYAVKRSLDIFDDKKDIAMQTNTQPQVKVAQKNIEKKLSDNGTDGTEFVNIQLQDGKKARINIENLQKMGLG